MSAFFSFDKSLRINPIPNGEIASAIYPWIEQTNVNKLETSDEYQSRISARSSTQLLNAL